MCFAVAGLSLRLHIVSSHYLGIASVLSNPDHWGNEMASVANAIYERGEFADPYWARTGPTATVPPIYPLLLALIYRVSGGHTVHAGEIVLYLNVLFSISVIPILYFLGEFVAGRVTGLLGAGLWALWPITGYSDIVYLWNTSLDCLLMALLMLFVLRKSYLLVLLPGVIILLETSTVVSVIAGMCWLFWNGHKRLALTCAASTVLIVSPWLVRNWLVMGKPVLRSNFGMELRRGVEEREYASVSGPRRIPNRDPDELALYRSIGEIAYHDRATREAVNVIKAQPVAFLSTVIHRVIVFWSGGPEAGILYSHWVPVKRAVNLVPLVLALIGLAGLVKRRSPVAVFLGGILLLQPLVYYVTLTLMRYRCPIEPTLMLLAGVGLAMIGELIHSRNVILSGAGNVGRTSSTV